MILSQGPIQIFITRSRCGFGVGLFLLFLLCGCSTPKQPAPSQWVYEAIYETQNNNKRLKDIRRNVEVEFQQLWVYYYSIQHLSFLPQSPVLLGHIRHAAMDCATYLMISDDATAASTPPVINLDVKPVQAPESQCGAMAKEAISQWFQTYESSKPLAQGPDPDLPKKEDLFSYLRQIEQWQFSRIQIEQALELMMQEIYQSQMRLKEHYSVLQRAKIEEEKAKAKDFDVSQLQQEQRHLKQNIEINTKLHAQLQKLYHSWDLVLKFQTEHNLIQVSTLGTKP